MKRAYGNYSRTSGITHYELGTDSLTVHFGPRAYRYTHAATGKHHVAAMTRMARSGSGLSSYIRRHQPQHEKE